MHSSPKIPHSTLILNPVVWYSEEFIVHSVTARPPDRHRAHCLPELFAVMDGHACPLSSPVHSFSITALLCKPNLFTLCSFMLKKPLRLN